MAEIIKSWQTKSGYKAKLLLMSMTRPRPKAFTDFGENNLYSITHLPKRKKK